MALSGQFSPVATGRFMAMNMAKKSNQIIKILTTYYADYFYSAIYHTIKNTISPADATPIAFSDRVYSLK
jgi:hypothetical protein